MWDAKNINNRAGLVENPPVGPKALDFFKEWILEIEDIVSHVAATLTAEVLPPLLYPVFARCLRTQASTFKEVFAIRATDGQHAIPYTLWYHF